MELKKRAIPEISEETKILASLMREMPEGQVWPNEKFARAIAVDVETLLARHRHNLRSARWILLRDEEIVIEAVPGVGLKRLQPGEIVAASDSGISRVRRCSRLNRRKLSCAKYAELTAEEKAQHALNGTLFGIYAAFSDRRKTRQIEAEVRKVTHSLPIRRVLELYGTNGAEVLEEGK